MSFVIVSSLGRLEQPIEKLSSAPITTREVADGKDLRISSSPGAIFQEGAFQRNVRPVLVRVKRQGAIATAVEGICEGNRNLRIGAISTRPSEGGRAGPARVKGCSGPRTFRGVIGFNRQKHERAEPAWKLDLPRAAFVKWQGGDKETGPSRYPDPVVHPRHCRQYRKGCSARRSVQNYTVSKLMPTGAYPGNTPSFGTARVFTTLRTPSTDFVIFSARRLSASEETLPVRVTVPLSA